MAIYLSNLYQFVGDVRDYIYQPVSTPLPPSIDWRRSVTAIENQGAVNSCTANSMSGACELILRSNGIFENLSRLFNYYESRKHGGLLGQDNGAYLRDAVSVVAKVGFPKEELWTYVDQNLERVPTDNVYEDAATRLLARYERINDGLDYSWNPSGLGQATRTGTSTIGSTQYNNDIKSALSEGYPVVIGMDLSDDFRRITGDFAYQNTHPYVGITPSNPKIGAHAVVIIGYIDAYNAFIILNSWGESWGYKGVGLLPYSQVVGLHEAWVLKGFMGFGILPSSNNPSNTDPVLPDFTTTNVTPHLYSDTLPTVTTLFQGSQLLNALTTITWVDILFAKGFSGAVTLKAAYLSLNEKIRFWLEETEGDTLKIVNADSFFTVTTGVVNPALNAYVVPVYSKSGAILILKVNIAAQEYLDFIQSTLQPSARATQTVSESLSLLYLISAASNLNSSTNRENGISLFDNAYLQVFNKNITMPENFRGYMHFLNSGFDKGMWVKQTKSGVKEDIYLSVANSTDGSDLDFGTPVMIAKNIGTLAVPVYNYPNTANLSVPNLKFYFTANAYGFQYSTTSPVPYLYATAADGSKFVFTVLMDTLNKSALTKEAVTFDMGSHYLGVYKSGSENYEGLGGVISPDLVKASIIINPTLDITGIRIVSTGGLSSNDLKIKQRSINSSMSFILNGNYPVLDTSNKIYLSFSEGNALDDPALYGDEIEITESGTYVLHSNLGGSITIVTNRLLYNPYYTGTEQLEFNNTDADIFSAVSPTQVLTGSSEYQCIYIKNRNPTNSFAEVKVWSDLNCNNLIGSEENQQYLKFSLNDTGDRTGTGVDNPTIGSKTQAPLNQVFNFANAESSALTILNLGPNECVPIWIKRVVKSSATLVKQDVLSYLRIKVKY